MSTERSIYIYML